MQRVRDGSTPKLCLSWGDGDTFFQSSVLDIFCSWDALSINVACVFPSRITDIFYDQQENRSMGIHQNKPRRWKWCWDAPVRGGWPTFSFKRNNVRQLEKTLKLTALASNSRLSLLPSPVHSMDMSSPPPPAPAQTCPSAPYSVIMSATFIHTHSWAYTFFSCFQNSTGPCVS